VPDPTPNWDEQDTRDRALQARGAIDELLGSYVDVIRGRCRAKCGPHGDDVAQQVCLRLWRELRDGKHDSGSKPFRVVVSGVVSFMCKGWEGTVLGRDVPFEEWVAASSGEVLDDVAGEAVAQLDVEAFVESLPPSDSGVARMRMLEHLEIDQIAEMTGRSRNAVDQALHRVRREWKRWLEA
jgi:RNA polymerase sigma factor (sigma-70 family)